MVLWVGGRAPATGGSSWVVMPQAPQWRAGTHGCRLNHRVGPWAPLAGDVVMVIAR